MSLVKLKIAVENFQSKQDEYAEFGAFYTETSAVFRSLLNSAAHQMVFSIPDDPDGWKLFDIPGSGMAARALERAATRALDILQNSPIKELLDIQNYVQTF